MRTDPEPMVVSGVNRELITRLSVPCVSEHSDKDNTFYQLMHTHTRTASFCLCICRCAEAIVTLLACCQGNE